MSANLLVDLDDFYTPAGVPATAQQSQGRNDSLNQGAHRTSTSDSQSFLDLRDIVAASALPSQQDIDADDDFGDFETAQPGQVAAKVSSALSDSPPSPQTPKKPVDRFKKPLPKRPQRSESVLFDADDEVPSDEDDDFGDFAGESPGIGQQTAHTSPPPVRKPSAQLPNLIDFDAPAAEALSSPAAPSPNVALNLNEPSLGFGQRSLANGLASVPKLSRAPTDSPEQPAPGVADWDDFEVAPPAASPRMTHSGGIALSSKESQDPSKIPSLPFHVQPPLSDHVPSSPQANIPPPAIILTTFPSIAEQARLSFFEPLSQAAGNQDALHAAYVQPQVRVYLSTLLTLSTVMARVIAGRKHRWKRDTMLAQSMRISQASAGARSGGMKLAGLDKAENAREERDVADAVRSWRVILGRLRTAVNAADNMKGIPEIKEEYMVRVANEREGAVSAPKHCILCGLKRNERVIKVDMEAQDSFGEWWVEHWGHRDCARFWETYEATLKAK